MSSTLGVWDHNYATGDFYYSETWKTMRGYAPDAEIDTSMESWIESVHPDDRTMVLDEVGRQGRGEDFQPDLFLSRTPPGRPLYLDRMPWRLHRQIR
ncbi:MAG: PAS domain-containing protein [Nitrospira sp.]